MPIHTADGAGAEDGAPVFQHVLDARDDGIEGAGDGLDRRPAHRLQHLGDAKGADQRRQQSDAAGQVGEAEGIALVVVIGLLTDGGDEQAEKAGNVALEGIAAGERTGHHDAEHGNPKKLETLEGQGELAQHRREEREAQDAEQRAKP